MATDRSFLIVTWDAWDETKDTGDGPVKGYVVKWREKSDTHWALVNVTGATKHIVSQLKPYTVYVVQVAAYREGRGGLGKPSPAAEARTKCAGSVI